MTKLLALMLGATIAFAASTAFASDSEVVLVDATIELRCAPGPYNVLDCVMFEDGIVVGECVIDGHTGEALCQDVY